VSAQRALLKAAEAYRQAHQTPAELAIRGALGRAPDVWRLYEPPSPAGELELAPGAFEEPEAMSAPSAADAFPEPS
jgi:hypothetical protein